MSHSARTGSAAAAPLAARTRSYYQTLSASAVGIELAVAVVLGLLLGRWLDGQLGTAPWLMIAWLIIGFAAGMRAVMRFAARDARATSTGTDAKSDKS